MAFDAGTIIAHLDLDDQDFDRKLREDVARIEAFEKRQHEISLKPDVDRSSSARAEQEIDRLDRKMTQDAHRRGGMMSFLMGGRGGSGGGSHWAMRLLSTSPNTGDNASAISRIVGAAGPGFGPIGAQPAMYGALGGLGLAALPALAGVGATAGVGAVGAGVIGIGAKTLIGDKKQQGPLYQQAQTLMKGLHDTMQQAARPMLEPLRRAFAEIPKLMHGLLPELKQLFAGASTLIQPLLHGLVDIAHDVLPGLSRAFRAVAPAIRPLLDGVGMLVRNIFPGLNALLKATAPTMGIFAKALANVGADLGKMFAAMAPAVRPSMIILKALLDMVGGLLPVIGKLAAMMAQTLAPVVIAIGQAFKILEPVLLIIGRLLVQFAGAVLKDLASVLVSVARLLADMAPTFSILGKALGQLFDTLEQSGAFGALASALEQIAPLLAQLINQLVRQLAPYLPVLIKTFAIFAQVLITGFGEALTLVLQGVLWLTKHFPFLVPLIAAITAVWVAWDAVMTANPIGLIIVAIGLLIGAITLLARHWGRVWGDIKNWAQDAWHFLTHGWGQFLFPQLYLIRKVIEFVRDHWRDAWNAIRGAARAAWHFIHDDVLSPLANFMTKTLPNAFSTAVRFIGKAWDNIRNAVKVPVKFVIGTVLDGLIGAFDWITSHMGLGRPIRKVDVSSWQTGGRIPGYGGGDRNLALLEGGEAVVSKETTAAHAADLRAWGVPGFQHGGVMPGTAGRTGQAAIQSRQLARGQPDLGGFIHKVGDLGKIMAAIATANSTALTNAIFDMLPHGVGGATADLAKVLTRAPSMLLHDAVHWLIAHGGGEGLGGRGPEIARYAMKWAYKVPYVWGGTAVPGGADCSGFVTNIYEHFGIHPPRTSEAQGSWVKRSGAVTGGLAFYNSPAGGPPPGHVAIVGFNGNVISQGGGLGPQIQGLHSMPLMFTGVPPGGAGYGPGNLRGLEQIWIGAGGPGGSTAHIAAAIAMAESGGREVKQQGQPPGLTGWGLWQITPTSGIWNNGRFGNLLNDSNNARAAVYLYRQAGGFSPWATYTSGRYQQFMDAGGWLYPGRTTVLNATRRREAVLTPSQSDAFHALAAAVHEQGRRWPGTGSLESRLDRLIRAVERNAAQTGGAVADALNGAARGAAYRSHYSASGV